ncbi:ABC transporter permease [Stieleria varia]|uniref:ABC-2 family transporter protein n=1 Tax=Stieleria varia TaxID=2528005 RepID=A0A5C6APT8_9BACT|nr:ABC transporter permease subunit [Stieleria varia]TWU01239.1 ABC-2 family transporter protein [Stieleria varia]
MASVTADLPPSETSSASWIDRIDAWCIRLGDSFNPILVKETRQALKSRQFVVTFSLVLFAALAWTVGGSLSMMPQIYTTPSAPRMMVGYYFLLAVPMMLVVPMAAYRSLEGEIDDGTLELLSITALSPWQIVLGKLASASLQMVLYFVALFPCLAYAYTLRGVDMPTTILVIGLTIVVAVFLTVTALFMATLSRARTGRILTLLGLLIVLLWGEYGVGFAVVMMITQGNPMTAAATIFAATALFSFALATGNLMLTIAAAQLTPESENRSTPVRLALLIVTAVLVSIAGLAMFTMRDDGIGFYTLCAVACAGLWTLASSMMVAESGVMTPRIQRELPSSFFGRMALTWMTPGPGTGLVFAGTVILFLLALQQLSVYLIVDQGWISGWRANEFEMYFGQPAAVYAGYLVGFLVVVRLVMMVVRLKNNPRVEIGLAVLVVVAVFAVLIPYSIELHYNDYRQVTYSGTQITNWGFTLSQSVEGRLNPWIAKTILGVGILMWMMALFSIPAVVQPRKTATPERVQEELSRG